MFVTVAAERETWAPPFYATNARKICIKGRVVGSGAPAPAWVFSQARARQALDWKARAWAHACQERASACAGARFPLQRSLAWQVKLGRLHLVHFNYLCQATEARPMHIKESNWQKSYFILSGNDAISIFSWSPNKFYHSLLGSQIKTVVKSCHLSERQRTYQKDKEPIVYEMNSARIRYKMFRSGSP